MVFCKWWDCLEYDNFFSPYFVLIERLCNQEFSARKLMSAFYKIMGIYSEFASELAANPMPVACDSISMAHLHICTYFAC